VTLLARLFSFPSTHLASCRPPLPSIISGLPVIRPECELATNPTVEGEATDTYLSEQRKRAGVKVTGSPCVWFGTTKVYSGVGADIVMESITPTTRGCRLPLVGQ
jgi:hypothetical protein